MAAPFLTDIELNYNQLLRGRLDNEAADVGSLGASHQGFALFRTDTKVARLWNGAAYDNLTGGVETVVGTTGSGTVQGVTVNSAAVGAGRTDQAITISVAAASGSAAGSMSAADYTKLANATATNAASSLVTRDGSGNFSAGVITASLTGTASNATNLNGQAASYYLDRTNHTGTQLAATISNLAATVQAYRLDQFAAPTAAVPMNGQRLTGLAEPSSGTDAATKNYVDSTAQGLDVKASVRLASTADINLTTGGLIAVDGVTVVAGDRILVKNQTTPAQNGIYVASAGAWTRATDFDSAGDASPGSFTFVEVGTTQADTGWVATHDSPVTLGTTAIAWAQFSATGAYIAGNGLTLTGNTFAVGGTANRITVSADAVDIAATYVGQTSITTLGTIGSGTWQGTAVGVAYGGTGATTAPAARTALGATTKVVGTITGNGVLTSFTFTHNLGSINHSLTLTDAAGNITYADFTLGSNADTIATSQAIGNGVVYTVIAIG